MKATVKYTKINLLPHGKNGGGFTLIELIVVLAIGALLISLLALSVRDGIERARSASCRNNLRQFGIAIGKYKSDTGGWFFNRPSVSTPFGVTRAIGVEGQDAHIIKASDGGGGEIPFSLDFFKDGPAGGVDGSGYYGTEGYAPGFVKNYLLSGNDTNILFCPKVNPDVFRTNSPMFKGLRAYIKPGVGEVFIEDECGRSSSYIRSAHLGYPRKNDHVVAFIDWNAAYGWCTTTNKDYIPLNIDSDGVWIQRKNTTGEKVRDSYGEEGTSKGAKACRTEIGYFHRSGTNYYANYVCVDGHVDSIASNAPASEFNEKFKKIQ